jgi:hypothetical protein
MAVFSHTKCFRAAMYIHRASTKSLRTHARVKNKFIPPMSPILRQVPCGRRTATKSTFVCETLQSRRNDGARRSEQRRDRETHGTPLTSVAGISTIEVGRLVSPAAPRCCLDGTYTYGTPASSHATGMCAITSIGEMSPAMITILQNGVPR